MALRAGYQGFKKLLPGLKLFRPGCLGIDNSELSKTFFPRSEQAVSGVVNYLDPTKLKATASGSSVTATKHSDGSMALSGTASATSGIQLNQTEITLPDGEWTFSLGRPIGCKVIGWAGGDTYQTLVDSDTGKATFTASSTYIGYYVQMKVVNGTAYSGYIYPMFSLDPDATYVPYAMNNKELTDALTPSAYINTGLTPTNGTISEGGYCKFGNLVLVNIRLQATTSATEVDISGFPSYTGANKVICSAANFSDDTSAYAYITMGGHLKIKAGDVVGSKNYVVSTAYLCDIGTANRSLPGSTREAAPEDVTPEEEPVVKKTTRKKSTAKADTEKEGE